MPESPLLDKDNEILNDLYESLMFDVFGSRQMRERLEKLDEKVKFIKNKRKV